MHFIEETNQTISNDDRFLNRIYKMTYTEYMSMDIETMMRQILDFIECQYDQGLFEQACGHVLSYRMTQPTFPE